MIREADKDGEWSVNHFRLYLTRCPAGDGMIDHNGERTRCAELDMADPSEQSSSP
jgi:hypothetical protein